MSGIICVMDNKLVTIITPTTGKNTLFRAIESLKNQEVSYEHILLWDDKRGDGFLYPDPETMRVKEPHSLDFFCDKNTRYSVVVPGSFVQGVAAGSSLRSVGLMLAKAPYVSFMDDDVWYEKDHLKSLLAAVKDREWAYCKRKVWRKTENDIQYIGVDEFESVGDSASRKVPYEMVDNNCMIFSRRFGTSGSVLYRETKNYNDDRQFYAFLKQHAGEPGRTNIATVNQVCPERLEKMFMELCTKENKVATNN